MDADVEVRRYRRGDIPILNEILGKVYGFKNGEDFWIWKYEKNPVGKNYSHVAVLDDKIVAHCGGMAMALQTKGEKFTSCQLADLLSDPDNRVKGAFSYAYLTTMAVSEEDGDLFVYGFANPQGTNFVVDKSGLAARGAMLPRLDRIVCVTPFIRRKLKSSICSALIGYPLTRLLRFFHGFGKLEVCGESSMEEITSFDERFDELWEEVAAEFPRTSVRDSRYLNWRYTNHPNNEYKILALSEQSKLRGFIVLRVIHRDGIRKGLIVDLVSSLVRPEIWNTLLVEGIECLEKEEAELITCWMFKHMPYHDSLKKLHFADHPSDLTVLCREYSQEHGRDFENREENWYLTMGDSDTF